MKNYLFILFFSYVALTFSQEKEKTNIYSNLFRGNLSYNTNLVDNFFLQNKLEISNAFGYNKIEFLPLSANYHITKKWTIFGGPKFRYSFIHDDYYLGNQSNFNTLIQIGTHYDFTRNFFGEIFYEYNLLNKNYSQELEESRGRLTFGVGIRF